MVTLPLTRSGRPVKLQRTSDAKFFRLTVTSDDLYLAHRVIIERTISHVCRRYHLSGAEGEDFASVVRVALIENGHARLRAFSGRSALQTYLAVVITRLLQDWRNAQWGKWRPSAEAHRLGPLAVRLETMTVRDKLSFDEAVETLRTNYGVTEDRVALEAMYARFPVRPGRSFTGEDVLERLPAPGSRADLGLHQAEAQAAKHRAAGALTDGLAKLPPQDRLLIKMRFDDGFSVADIAKVMQVEAKPLYRRIERLLVGLRQSMEESGVSAEMVRQVLGECGFAFEGRDTRVDVRPFDRSSAHSTQEGAS